jgi:heterodisulfide reductase subunit C
VKCDLTFKKQIEAIPGGKQVTSCFLCGTCSAGCPISKIDDAYSPRNIMRKVLLGDKEGLLNTREIWKCIQCQACVARCPQDARPADVIEAVREYAVSEGRVSQDVYDKVNALNDEMKILQQEKVNELLDQGGVE